ncbi:MAG: c-type cytochrome [Gammaproteobacteria bacterium]
MLKYFGYSLSLALLLTTGQYSIAADIEAGKQKSQTCAACHGPDGNSNNSIWPKLAGQHVQYTAKQLQDFKQGKRENAQMAPLVSSLSEEDMRDIAAYYADQKGKVGSADPEYLEEGEKIYRFGNAETGVPGCMACHGPNGKGNPAAMYPMLSGQHADYTAAQLQAFRSGERSNDNRQAMRILAEKMSDAEIKAVSEYIQGLR